LVVQQPHVLVVNPHHFTLDVNLEPILVQLATTNIVDGEAWYVVGVGKGVVLLVLAREVYGTASLNLDEEAIT
jgi:hypothetical protein